MLSPVIGLQRCRTWFETQPAASRQLLFLLLAGDFLFLVLHIGHFRGPLADPRFSIETDQGFAEVFQYIKEYWISLSFAYLAVSRRQMHYAVWSALFAYILTDDWFMLHEQAGALFAARYPIHFLAIPQLRPEDLGELAFAAAIGAVLLPLLALTYLRSTPAVRRESQCAAVLLAALIACGVGLDLAHQLLYKTRLFGLMGMAEDGGEMLITSLLCAYAANLCRNVSSTTGRSSDPYPNTALVQSTPAPADAVSPPRR